MFCFVLCACLLGVWGFSDAPVATLVARESAELIAADVLAQHNAPVLLSAQLVKTRFFMKTGLGGEPVDFLVDGKSIGQTMTGGDGWARKEYVPKRKGTFEYTVKLAHGRRVKAQSRSAMIGSVSRNRPIVLVELQSAMAAIEVKSFGPIDLSALGKTPGNLPDPMPSAAAALTAVSKRAALLYLFAGTDARLSNVHDWLTKHEFPSAPVFILSPGARALASKVEGWKDEGWTNIQAGISADIDAIEEYLDQELHAVMLVADDEEEDIPEEVTVVSDWKELATVKALKFK